MKTVLVICLFLLAGCGVSSYNVKPMLVDGETHCCEVSIYNSKEIDHLDVYFAKNKDGYVVSVQQRGVRAFDGQQVGADAVAAAVKTGAAVLIAPAAAGVGAAAIGAIAK